MQNYTIRARNTAPDSENRMHENQTAAAYGFRGGLVPGFSVYTYMTVPVVREFGRDWLERGAMRVRFLAPAYDGDILHIRSDQGVVTAQREDGTVCARGELLWPRTAAPALAEYPERPLPAERPPASAESLTPGRMLGTVRRRLALPDATYLALHEEQLPFYRDDILHPGALLELSNRVLMENVVLGPWIHAASDLRHFSMARGGDEIALRGRVAERYERKGHQFVVLDILVTVDDARVVQHVRHTAIYEPRAARAAGL